MKNYTFSTRAILAIAMVLFFAHLSFGQCVIQFQNGQSYVEDFESGTMECWTVESTGSATWSIMTGTSSSVVAFQNANTGDEARLISPTFDMTGIDGATFSFAYAMMALYNNDVLTVGYRTAPTDSWHELGSYSLNDWSNTYEAFFELPNPSATYQISFLGHCNGGYYIFIDNIEITPTLGCAKPVNLNARDITAFSAQLEWSTTGNEDSWLLEMNGQTTKVTTMPFQATELTPQTDYTFRVKAQCSETLSSEWSLPYTFKTLCDVITVTDEEPYFDDFEASEEFVCWQNEIALGEDGWVIDPGYLILNNTAFFIWMGVEAQLVSAPLDISAVTKPVLIFKRRQPLSPDYINDELSVWYLTNNDIMWRLLGSYPGDAEEWETIQLDLPDPTGRYQIAFLARSHDGDGVYVDDVWVGNDPTIGVAETLSLCAVASPNPANETILLAANVADAMVEVFDMMGRKTADALLSEGRAVLDLNGFAPGVYLARVSAETGVTTLRFVKE